MFPSRGLVSKSFSRARKGVRHCSLRAPHLKSCFSGFIKGLRKATVKCSIQQIFAELFTTSFKIQDVYRVINDVARMAAAKRLGGLDIVFPHEALRQARRTYQSRGLADAFEDVDKFMWFWTRHEHLILNAAQERFVAQVIRLQVRREDKESLKRHCDLAARMKIQVI